LRPRTYLKELGDMVSESLIPCLCPLSVGDLVTVVLTIGRTHKLH
jgi:hypothetical protein